MSAGVGKSKCRINGDEVDPLTIRSDVLIDAAEITEMADRAFEEPDDDITIYVEDGRLL